MRKAGILMPVASLPSKYGIGDFGHTSYEFIDLCYKTNLKIWQILPLNPLGFGNSPYQPYSSYAMDELYVGLDMLVEDGLLSDVKEYFANSKKIHYQKIRKYKEKYLKKAFLKFKPDENYYQFIKYHWVNDYAIFITLKKHNNLELWTKWKKEDKEYINKPYKLSGKLKKQVAYETFIQYILYKQWLKLRAYANKLNIEIMGDIPIYVGIDSLDVWKNQESFLLDSNGNPKFIAGCPPDYFSEDGQRWGNPIYDWEQLEKDDFKFWLERLSYSDILFDITRIDHFRAFDTYWKIPESSITARIGEWVEAPGYRLFDKVFEVYPNINIVVEDLGDLRKEVLELRDHFNLMGMRIVQHSFDAINEMDDKEHLLAYTGTHDNETLKYWYHNLSKTDKKNMRKYFKKENVLKDNIIDSIINYTLNTKANLVILPMVDILHKNDKFRINFPGTVGSPNWEMKLNNYQEFIALMDNLKSMINKANR